CDHGNYNFKWDEEAYIEAGFTETDFQLLDQWVWNDTEYFNLDKLKTMQRIGAGSRKDRIRFDSEVIGGTFKKIAEAPTYGIAPVLFLSLLILGLFFLKKRYKLMLLVQSVWVIVLYFLLTCSKRVLWRVEIGIWLSAFILSIALIIGTRAYKDIVVYGLYKKTRKPAVICVTVLALAICAFNVYGKYRYFTDQKDSQIVREPDSFYEKIQCIREREGFYVTDVDTVYGGLDGAKNIFDIDRKYLDLYDNICQIGGWIMPSPIGLYHAYVNDIDNPMRALVERDDVFYIGNGERAGYLYVFLNEKYGPGIGMDMVDEVCGAPVWKFHR
ncbi:MAG: hypothetical protein IKZ97_02055, partial [Butyrivibrio sp.]|nr:hypothetical protein [Butyrivibrio sp.]